MTRLTGRDYLLLALYAVVLFSFSVLFDRPLSTHETVHCVNIREMRQDGDWVIPHFGGRPWLERPPLPFWLTMPVVAVVGDVPAAYRLPPLLVAVGGVLLVGWMASTWFGRGVGLLAGLILATMREFTHYATAPECDMFLCGVVTAALALFVRLEFGRRSDGEGGLVGRRPWPLLAFFAVLGLGNLVKGLFFGDLMILLPVAAFLLAGERPWARVRRYVWLPGWAVFLAVGGAWALAAYLRHPDIVELWQHDYGGRVSQGYMREPAWYYLVHLPWILFPWTIAAGVGLWATRRRALAEGRTPERFLWLWAIVPVVFFSIPQGKHHHYLLHVMAPWAVLAAVGAVRIWQWLPSGWTERLAWRPACAGVFAVLPLGLWASHAAPTWLNDRYSADLAFVAEVRRTLPEGSRLVVMDYWGPLDSSWLLFYFDGRAQLLHNLTFLRDGRIREREVYLVSRPCQVADLARYGQAEVLLQSERSRDEKSPEYRYTLYKVRLRDDVPRHRGGVYISPMQATGRAPGPELR